ncbi:hypothetical protein [Sulfitobacter sp. W002]|uniref:hypothetical protein n=1 Tax=Sulfitobacter sp. W002 TaxID=2867024 RepID=UPI0021A6CA21|nr:hypothetical protein [Sulfitobacter sp. W002]
MRPIRRPSSGWSFFSSLRLAKRAEPWLSPAQSKKDIRPGGHAPVLEPEDATDKNERPEDHHCHALSPGGWLKKAKTKGVATSGPDHRAEQNSADHPAQQDGHEDQPTEEPE